MSLTRKDYVMLAEMISGHIHSADTHVRKEHREIERYALEGLAETLADKLSNDNKAFDRDIFLEACGVINDKEN